MYFPALKTAIQNLEEKRFYDVALMYLTQLGYQELSIVDGAGDGGRDVICSRDDLRIQLSVRKDWEAKINEEAANAESAGERHLIYITNRIISPHSEQSFLDTKYKFGGDIEVSVHDLRRIATALARPGVIRSAYEMLGMAVPTDLQASPQDIAMSSLLLFSPEVKELREEVIGAKVRAHLFKHPGLAENALIHTVAESIPGVNTLRTVGSILASLRQKGKIVGKANSIDLSQSERELMSAAEVEYLTALNSDVRDVAEGIGLSHDRAKELLDIALELLVRSRGLDGAGPAEEALRTFLAHHGLTRKRASVYEVLAKTRIAKIRQHGATIDQMFSTNTFDIYRALGRRTNLTMVLDASVAMPVVFGLAFGAAKSRYGVAALALKEACDAHQIKMAVPRAYLNEMAAHGQQALAFLEIYNSLPEEARTTLRASGNAYLSHFSHIASTIHEAGDTLTLSEFLGYFGVTPGRSNSVIENKIQSVLDQFGIKVIPNGLYEQDIRNRILEKKPKESKILVDHDAIVCTLLKNEDEKGFILATWDRVMIDLVEDLARVFADTPAHVIDFLSMATGEAFETDRSYEMAAALLHTDERVAERLARKIEEIKSIEQAYKLDKFVRGARTKKNWRLKVEDVSPFLDDVNVSYTT